MAHSYLSSFAISLHIKLWVYFFFKLEKPYKGDKQDLKSKLDLSLLLNSNFF